MLKQYSVTLEESEVTEAQEHYKDFGGKLSPLLNKLLSQWNMIQRSNIKELPKKKKKDITELDNFDVDIDTDDLK